MRKKSTRSQVCEYFGVRPAAVKRRYAERDYAAMLRDGIPIDQHIGILRRQFAGILSDDDNEASGQIFDILVGNWNPDPEFAESDIWAKPKPVEEPAHNFDSWLQNELKWFAIWAERMPAVWISPNGIASPVPMPEWELFDISTPDALECSARIAAERFFPQAAETPF